ncbi:uncharacterized protein LOC130671308 [Microplitis mediator]|uniref:uncharacterized protein LOC130671308 n=1 Tax=Microplitis mediator TaxID=375433 RepID=UPI002554F175|nr:uncharacterized protein LOC130671308 [Microplitis mediator]
MNFKVIFFIAFSAIHLNKGNAKENFELDLEKNLYYDNERRLIWTYLNFIAAKNKIAADVVEEKKNERTIVIIGVIIRTSKKFFKRVQIVRQTRWNTTGSRFESRLREGILNLRKSVDAMTEITKTLPRKSIDVNNYDIPEVYEEIRESPTLRNV